MKFKTKRSLCASIVLSSASLVTFSHSAFSETLNIEAESFIDYGGTVADGNPSQPVPINIYTVNGESAINFVNNGDYVDFNINAAGGIYEVEYQVGTNVAENSNIEFFVNQSGSWVSQGTVAVPQVGWDNFQPLKANHDVNLASGASQVRLQGVGNNWQWNLESFSLTSTATPTPTPTPTQAPSGQSAFVGHSIPGIIEAEDFDNGGEDIAYNDTSAGNTGNAYRTSENVDIQTTTDAGAGFNVGWVANNEWLEYTIGSAVAGTYDIDIRVAANGTASGKSVRVLLGNTDLGTATVNGTGGWQTWQTISLNNVSVQGDSDQVLRLEFIGGGFNINWVEFDPVGASTPTPTPVATPVPTPTPTPNGPVDDVIVEAEDFDITDTTTGSDGTVGFGLTATGINWNTSGDWADYSVTFVVPGAYSVILTAGTISSGDINAVVTLDGSSITGSVQTTGGWDTNANNTLGTINVPTAGTYTVRLASSGTTVWQWNADKFIFVHSGSATPTPTPVVTPTPTPTPVVTPTPTPTPVVTPTPTPTPVVTPTPTPTPPGEDGYPFTHDGPGLIWGYVEGAANWADANPYYELSEDALKTEDTISGNTTVILSGRLYDADGDISFYEHIDDSVRLYINGTLVLSNDSWENASQTPNLNLTPGWNDFELRTGNADGGSGPVSGIGFGVDVNGGTNFVHPSTLATNIFSSSGTINGDPNRVPPGGIVIELEYFDDTGTLGRVTSDSINGFNSTGTAVNYVTNGDWGDYQNTFIEAGTYRAFIKAEGGDGSYGARIELDRWPVAWGYFGSTGGASVEVELDGGDFVVEESRNYTVRVQAIGGSDWQWTGDSVRFAKVSDDAVRPSARYNPDEHTVAPVQGPATGLQYLKEPVQLPTANKVLKSDVWYTYAQNNELDGYSVDEFGATGSFWGHPPEENFYDDAEIIEWAANVQGWQDLGIEFTARGEFDWGFRWVTEYLTNPEPHYVKTLDDRNVRMVFMNYLSYNGYNNNWLSNHSPAFVPHMKSQVDQILKSNPDKLMFDTQTNSTRTTDLREFGGDFSYYSMENFNTWLSKKYGPVQLAAMGISDINTFNYGEFLIEQGITHTEWKNAGNTISGAIPMIEDFIYFNRDVWNQKFGEVLDYIRVQRPNIEIGASTQLFESRGYLFNENITFLANELFLDVQLPLTELPTNIIAQLKAAEAVDKTLAYFPYPSEFNKLRLNNATRFGRGWIAQAYAYGGLFSIPAAVWVGDDALPFQTWNIPAENYRDIYRFVRDNETLFDDYTSYSKVGLVHAMYSSMKANQLNGGNQILSSTRILTEDNINFDLLVFGDEGYPVVPRAADFDQFDHIFFDGDLSLLTTEQKAVLDAQGSKVRHIGQRGAIDGIAIDVSINGTASNTTVSTVTRIHETNTNAPYVVHLVNRPFAGGVTPTLNNIEVAIPQSYFPENITTATLHLPGGSSTNLGVSTNAAGDAVIILSDLEVWGILELGH